MPSFRVFLSAVVVLGCVGSFVSAESQRARRLAVTAPDLQSFDLSAAVTAAVTTPEQMWGDTDGMYLYIADSSTDKVSKVTLATGAISVLAGTGIAAYSGDGGAATSAELDAPTGVWGDSQGRIYIADSGNLRVRVVGTDGIINAYAGTGISGAFATGNGVSAVLGAEIDGLAGDATGNVYVSLPAAADSIIAKIAYTTGLVGGAVTRYAGKVGVVGIVNGAFDTATLTTPGQMFMDWPFLYVAGGGFAVRRVDSVGTITNAAGTGITGVPADGVDATAVALADPVGVWVSADSGELYITHTTGGLLIAVELIAAKTPNYPAKSGALKLIPMVTASDGSTADTLTAPTGVVVSNDGVNVFAGETAKVSQLTHTTVAPTSMPSSAPSFATEAWGQITWDKRRHRTGGLCENHCSNHGTCEMNNNCKCYTGLDGEAEWTGPDCSQRTCPKDYAWVGEVVNANNLHPWTECSNKGTCDRTTGACNCFPGYDGVACQRTVCHNNCNDRGTCWPEKHLASKVNRMYMTPWDAMKHVGCLCDAGYRGPSCEFQECPSGTDPLDGYGNEAGRDCSGRGLCNFNEGTCSCFSGFFGTRCQYQTTIF